MRGSDESACGFVWYIKVSVQRATPYHGTCKYTLIRRRGKALSVCVNTVKDWAKWGLFFPPKIILFSNYVTIVICGIYWVVNRKRCLKYLCINFKNHSFTALILQWAIYLLAHHRLIPNFIKPFNYKNLNSVYNKSTF